MDKITIKDFEVFAYHGVLEEENRLGQKFIITVEMFCDFRSASTTDDVTKTVNYAEACYKIEELMTTNTYKLIETCAEKIAELILTEYSDIVKETKVIIKKPSAPVMRSLAYPSVEVTRSWNEAFISLGSNMGDTHYNISEALKLIETKTTKVVKKASLIETKPVGYEDQDNFLNTGAKLLTLLSHTELVEHLLSVEQMLKRERTIHWGPRTLDLDLILYNDIISDIETAIVPHPRMHERLFVLIPMCELAPYKLHPILKKSMIDLKTTLEQTETVL